MDYGCLLRLSAGCQVCVIHHMRGITIMFIDLFMFMFIEKVNSPVLYYLQVEYQKGRLLEFS